MRIFADIWEGGGDFAVHMARVSLKEGLSAEDLTLQSFPVSPSPNSADSGGFLGEGGGEAKSFRRP